MIQILLGVAVVGLFVIGVYVVQSDRGISAPNSELTANTSSALAVVAEEVAVNQEEMKKDEMMGESVDGAAMKKDEMMKGDAMKDVMEDTESAPAANASKAQYVPYVASAVATYAERGDVVLFFRASWCPSCRALDADITKNLEGAPDGLTILDIDYDTATELRQRYGVTTQHTLVQVAADGTLIKKWSGGSTLASVVAQVQ